MNITKRDVLELRRRMKKTECSITRLCGCYVNSGKQVVLTFAQPFLDLEDDEFYKYLEIAKKALSGTLGGNLLELEFARTDEARQRQQFLLALRDSKLKNGDLLERLYEQVIAEYAYPGNYLILLFHDVYDVMTRTSDRQKLDESSEVYEYLIGAVCPVELSKPGLGYREEENRIGVCARDWVVGAPDIGFVYPAFADRGSDVNAVMYYVRRQSHPELIENVLGCCPQRTAAEQKTLFEDIVKGAFDGQDDAAADAAFGQMQRTLSGLVAEQEEDEDRPPVVLTAAAVSGAAEDAAVPAPVRQRMEQDFAAAFGDALPPAQNLLDAKAAAQSAQRQHTAALEQKVAALQQRLAAAAEDGEDDGRAPWEDGADIELRLPEERADRVRTGVVDGERCLLVPLRDGESARINGVDASL